MWEEWARATGGAVDPAGEERSVCTLDLDLRVLDLRSSATREALGVSLDQLTAGWDLDTPNRACLAVARAARESGADGIVVPSAARDGGWNVAILPRAFAHVKVIRQDRAQPAPVS